MKTLDNLRMTPKMMLAFGALLCLLAVQAVAAFSGIGKLDASSQHVSTSIIPTFKAVGELRAAMGEYRGAAYQVFMASTPAMESDAYTRYESLQKRIDDAITAYPPLIATPQEGALYETLKVDWQAARKSYVESTELLRGGERERAVEHFMGDTYKRHFTAFDTLTKMIAEVQRQIDESDVNSRATVSTTRTTMWIVVGVSVVTGMLIAWFFARMISRGIGEAVRAAENVAAGNLDGKIEAGRKDEIGQLLGAMQRMQSQVQSLIAAQSEMATRHDAGTISFRMDDSRFPGEYGRMARDTNALVASHLKAIDDAQRIMQRYSIGDLSVDMDRLPGEKAKLTQTMDATKANLSAINAEIKRLAGAAAAGDFTQRGDLDQYQFDFRDMVAGLNGLMETTDGNLAQVSALLQAIARGDLTTRMEGDFHGVFASMRDDANATVTQLTEIVAGIQEASTSINTAAGEIASGNSDLSRRTEQQAANLEETAASMEELTSTVRQNAESARQANQLAIGAASVASQGGEVVGKVVTTMTEIEHSSRKIAEIISVIDGIAFQTNILALNAAVEAARAGEQGRGFAVVASEVRTLAQRSANAAKEIKGLIETSVDKVADGSALVNQAGTTMGEIVASVQRVTDIMAEISAASQEQSAGIEQVNQTITQMDETTQQNAALVEEASAAARSMEEQAIALNQAVASFRLPDDDGSVASQVRERVSRIGSAVQHHLA